MRIRFKHFSFASQLKLGATVSLLAAVAMIPLVVLAFATDVFPTDDAGMSLPMWLFVSVFTSLMLSLAAGAIVMILYLAGLLLLRALPWGGPALEGNEERPGVGRIFE